MSWDNVCGSLQALPSFSSPIIPSTSFIEETLPPNHNVVTQDAIIFGGIQFFKGVASLK
ncbi:hypothetical protein [Hymenobacter sp. UV11]|uniref:hypothetical protein n=1 Tax=Hymenobacter sp. UV11 TaxID=1849735 RepID=UPI0014326C21|nr:hypothetical protein [Hymenobacter sp. UV11]